MVMTHPRRWAEAEALRARHPELALDIVVDPDPGSPPSALRTARLAWQAVTPEATHHLVLQDDAILSPDFLGSLSRAVAHAPDRPLALFVEWGCRTAAAVRLTALLGLSSTDVLEAYVPTVALVLPADLARRFDAYVEELHGQDGPDDTVLADYLRTVGVIPHVVVPNLVQHGIGPSLVDNGADGLRRAACFHPHPGNPSNRRPGSLRPTVVPYFSAWSGRSTCLSRPSPASPWTRTPTARFLRERGDTTYGDNSCLQDFRTSLGDIEPLRRLRGVVGPQVLDEFWLTAYAMGTILGQQFGAVDPSLALKTAFTDSVVVESLSTMAPGGLWRLVEQMVLDPAVVHLSEAVCNGVRAGCLSAM